MDERNNSPASRRSNVQDASGLPARRTVSAPTPIQSPLTHPAANPEKMADVRKDLGFDDIPIDEDDMQQVRFRDIFRAWAKQSIKHSPLEDGIKQAATKKARLNELKNDLKWALQADLDEPVKVTAPVKKPASPNPQANVPPANHANTSPTRPAPSKTIDINISFGSLPKLPSPAKAKSVSKLVSRLRSFRLTPKRIIALTTLSAVIIVSGVMASHIAPSLPGAPNSGTKVASDEAAEKPTYLTLLPSGKSIDSLGGWHRVSPPDRDPVFAYVDTIDNVTVNVSQQPLPQGFKTNTTDSVAELAKSYGATHKITAGSHTLYVGTSAQGPQSVILAKDDTLILMKSTQKITDDAWSSYVKSLD